MVVDWKKSLLTSGKSNTKVAKNLMETYYLSLQPTNLNSKGENLCKFSTKECRTQCLQYAGRQGFSNVVKSRERKTEMLVYYRKRFLGKLWSELDSLDKKGKCAVRLNLLSDLNWQEEFIKIGEDLGSLKKLQLYDYTKDHVKIFNNTLSNYHMTLSYSGSNWRWCDSILSQKIANVAVVFEKEIPATFKNYSVIDGTISDERFLDPKGVIIGLKYKKPKGRVIDMTNSKFIVK